MTLADRTDTIPTVLVRIRDDVQERRAQVHAFVRDYGGELAGTDGEAALILCAPGGTTVEAGVPVLIYGASNAPCRHLELPAPAEGTAFGRALSPWLDRGAAFDRMVSLFGEAALGPLAARLAGDLDRFLTAAPLDTFATHTLGGFAGTLGFRRFAHCAERLSRCDESYRRAARLEAGWALAIMRNYLRKSPDPTTLV